MVSSRTSAACKYNRTEGRKFMRLTFCIYKKDQTVLVQMDKQAALAYLVKMRDTITLLMLQEVKQMWEFYLTNQITFTSA